MFTDIFKSATTTAEVQEKAVLVTEAIKTKKIDRSKVSLLDVAEATLGNDYLRELRKTGDSASMLAQESVAPVNLSAFTNITGTLIQQGVYDAYTAPEYIGSKLVTEETSREDNTRTPGLAPIDDDALTVEEGGEFPDVKFGEDYIDVPGSIKKGLKIGITKEMIFFDRTGQVMEMAQTIGDRLALNKEKRILNVVLGVTNTFKRKGVTSNTYVTTGNRINDLTNVLTDYTSLDASSLAFGKLMDDRKVPEPIVVNPTMMLVNDALQYTARNILNATEINLVPASTGGVLTKMANPYNNTTVMVATPWMRKLLVAGGVAADDTAAAKYWLRGDFKRAFRYRTLFPLATIAATNDKDSFDRDIVAQFRTSERGVAYVYAPWYVQRNHG